MFKVLIADDNISDRNGLLEYIPWQSLDCTVVGTAENGLDGYNKAAELKPDIIITDISMPVMNGIEMTSKLHEILPGTQFIFMSCFDEFEYAQSAIKYGVVSYVLKPVNLDEIIESILYSKGKKEAEIKKELIEYNLRCQVNESMPILRENFLISVLHGKIRDKKELEKRADFLGIDKSCFYRLILFQIAYSETDGETDRTYIYTQLLIETIQAYIKETSYCADCFNGTVSLMLPSCADITDAFVDIFAGIQSKFKNDSGFEVMICIGTLKSSLCELPSEFRNLEGLMSEERFTRSGSIIIADDVSSLKSEPTEITFSDIYLGLSEIFNLQSNADDFIEKYYSPQYVSSETVVKTISFCVISNINILLLQRNENFKNIFGNDISVFEKLFQYNSIVNIKQWIKNIIIMTQDYLAHCEQSRNNNTVKTIKELIEKDYASIQTLSQISSKVYMSTGYANRLFKKHVGETILDYLLKTRIEAAKKLLLDRKYKIYEIGEMVGYQSSTYFNTSFKQYTKMTPNEFRNKFC